MKLAYGWCSWFVISILLLGMSACNSGSSSTAHPSNLKEITEYSFSSPYGKINGVISGHNISVTMPYGTDVTALVATFKTTGKSTSVGGVTHLSGVTSHDFTYPVVYTVTAEDGGMTQYTVTVKVPTELFSCVKDPITNNACGCLLENDGSGLIWYADGGESGIWTDWFSSSNGNGAVGKSLKVFNNANHCGTSHWHLPTSTNIYGPYVDSMGGNWGALGTYAKNNGWLPGSGFYIWLNSNNFTNITTAPYWSNKDSVLNGVSTVWGYSGKTLAANTSDSNYILLVAAAPPIIQTYSITTNGKKYDGTISSNNINVQLPSGTDIKSLIAKFTTPAGESVAVGSTAQVSGTTPNNFTSPVSYVVTAADGSTAQYTVTVTFPPLFTCITDNSVNPANPCGCLQQNDGGGLIWYGSSLTNSDNGYTFEGPSIKSAISNFNSGSGHCGYTDWRIPTLSTTDNNQYFFGVRGNKIDETTDFGKLGSYAAANGYTSGYYPVSDYDLTAWLNARGFSLMTETACFNSSVVSCFYWSSSVYDSSYGPGGGAWSVDMNYGYVAYSSQGNNALLLPVRGGQ